MNYLTAPLLDGKDLSPEEITMATSALLDPEGSVDEKAAFLKALALKGETPAEIAGFVEEFLKHAEDPGIRPEDFDAPMIDVCGTGGDGLNLFNVSTTCIFILAAAGLIVVKHGNRGITSKSGGADVLEALGIRIDLGPEDFSACVKKTGLGFLFAPRYHPAFKAVVPVRQQLASEGQRTIFNILGPLLNPARPDHQLVGVFSPALPEPYADILSRLGRKQAWAVHGTTAEGKPMDEVSTLGPTTVVKTIDGALFTETVNPADLGLTSPSLDDLRGGDATENARILEAILSGHDEGPRRDLVALNAGAALVIGGKAANLKSGMQLAIDLMQNGGALAKLRALQDYSASVA